MLVHQWRKFQFFDRDELHREGSNLGLLVDEKLNVDESNGATVTAPPTCCTAGRGQLFVGDSQGCIRMITRDMQLIPFQAHDNSVSLIHRVR